MKLKYFGTDGIRGLVGGPMMNPEFIKKFATGLARYLRVRHPKGEVHLVIGRDTRQTSEEYEKIIASVVCPYGINVDILGVVPTPAVSFWVDEMEADNAVMITASHNDASYNGIKVFNAFGEKQLEDKEEMLEALMDDETPVDLGGYKACEYVYLPDGVEGYVENVTKVMSRNALKGWKILLDCANGATYQTSRMAFEYLGAELVLRGIEPNGLNINEGVGSEYPQEFAKVFKESGARIGIAHDGDGDRVILCDENGEIVPGDQILGIIALHALAKGQLNKKIFVATYYSNKGLDMAIEKAGGTVVRSNVGDRNLFQKMEEVKANLGGESSGHIIFAEYSKTGDGLLAAIKIIETMIDTGRTLADLRTDIPLLPQELVNLKIQERKPMAEMVLLDEAVKRVEEFLGEEGRVFVRFSGTEPKIRLLVEGPEK
ncbi:MAG: phosphoglucosamine mutase, partial [Verrucomicrobia bacterium]